MFRTQFTLDENEDASYESALRMIDPETGEIQESRTQQEFAEDADINVIVKRFGLTGEMPEVWEAPQSGDFVDAVDFHTAMNAVRAAEEKFMELPPDVRYRFANDPQRLMEFLEDGKNRDEAMKLGLLKPKEQPVRDAVVAIDELAGKLVPPKP